MNPPSTSPRHHRRQCQGSQRGQGAPDLGLHEVFGPDHLRVGVRRPVLGHLLQPVYRVLVLGDRDVGFLGRLDHPRPDPRDHLGDTRGVLLEGPAHRFHAILVLGADSEAPEVAEPVREVAMLHLELLLVVVDLPGVGQVDEHVLLVAAKPEHVGAEARGVPGDLGLLRQHVVGGARDALHPPVPGNAHGQGKDRPEHAHPEELPADGHPDVHRTIMLQVPFL